ncbi:MAG: methyltransferase domain-containing protein [Thermoplasmata archaeon]|nr:methyltransferase domain-containing protein [Thermoplasmata archaeon]
MAVDAEKLNAFVGKFVNDLGATMHGATILVGEQLGLYKALADGKHVTSEELARKTGTPERYLREWLAGQAASGYVEYDASANRYFLSPEQALALTDEESPIYIPGAYYLAASMYKDQRKVGEAIRAGTGFCWHEHHNDLYIGCKKFFKPGYLANLVGTWLPSLEGVVAKLEKGATVADVGCGLGASTIIMAKAFPNSKFVGFDYHTESIEWARNDAETQGVGKNVDFEVALASGFRGKGYDLVTFFDCLHDMGDPVGAAKHVRQALKPDGTWMVVEPFANATTAENLNPVGRIYYNASLMLCVPSSLSQEGAKGLGAQASDKSLTEVFHEGGFTRVRRAVENPFNRVFEVRP